MKKSHSLVQLRVVSDVFTTSVPSLSQEKPLQSALRCCDNPNSVFDGQTDQQTWKNFCSLRSANLPTKLLYFFIGARQGQKIEGRWKVNLKSLALSSDGHTDKLTNTPSMQGERARGKEKQGDEEQHYTQRVLASFASCFHNFFHCFLLTCILG